MKVYVYRHALAAESMKGVNGERKEPGISQEGREQIERVCTSFLKLHKTPGLVLTSPVRRAKETAELAVGKYWPGAELRETASLRPMSQPEKIFSELGQEPESEDVVLVTHYPIIQKMLRYAFGSEIEMELPNGGILCIGFDGHPSEGRGMLVSCITADM